MSDQPQMSRRQTLKFLSAIPLLPLGTMSLLSGCASPERAGGDRVAPSLVSAHFVSMPAPALADTVVQHGTRTHAMATTTVSSALEMTLSDGSIKRYRLAYQAFFQTGERVPDGRGGQVIAGGYVDIHNRPLIDRSVPGSERQYFSDAPDGTTLLTVPHAQVPGVRGNPVFAVVQFEYMSRDLAGNDTYGRMPSPIAVLTLDQNPATGALTLVKYHQVDTSAAHGLWITCGASLSPWGTHLSSEEYEPDAFKPGVDAEFAAFSTNLFGDPDRARKYHYGHLPEVTVLPDGSATLKKHYCLGRISHELVQVMPDNRTVLMGDDYTNGGLFLFVADREKDLSSGTLYVAALGAGLSLDVAARGADLSWIRLGHASSDEVKNWADTLRPTDIMDVRFADPGLPGYRKVFVDGKANWIKLQPGMARQAAFLETHRYANLIGGSMGFTKMEGTTVNIRDRIAYSALANIQSSMVRGHPAWREELNVTVDKERKAGGILAHALTGGHKDSGGRPIESDWVPAHTRMLLAGTDIAPDALGNTADPDNIASPDNIKFSETLRVLFIGEDSGNHVNNFLWAYHVDTGKLSRILSTPAGAECTGLHAVDEINGWTYVMSNFQHAGDWNAKLHGKVRAALDADIRANYNDRYAAAVGYLTADPVGIRAL